MFKKIIEKIFGKRCKCITKTVCDHARKDIKYLTYCLDCKLILDKNN